MKKLKGILAIIIHMITNVYIVGIASVFAILWIGAYEAGTRGVFTPYYFAGTVAVLWLIFFSRKKILKQLE